MSSARKDDHVHNPLGNIFGNLQEYVWECPESVTLGVGRIVFGGEFVEIYRNTYGNTPNR